MSKAHPRSRGEHGFEAIQFAERDGSSPLARGTRSRQFRERIGHRLIPARAGNTLAMPGRFSPCTAHPRSRGEHARPPLPAASEAGSSPLARGTPTRYEVEDWNERLIPARAGNTFSLVRQCRAPPAHPRSRGEHSTSPSKTTTPAGSSPLARGTLWPSPSTAMLPRLIPARAGNTIAVMLMGGVIRLIPARAGNTPPFLRSSRA